jgi:hypothetical protein
MDNPLYIVECVRKNGVTYLSVEGHGLTEADEGRALRVAGADRTVNGDYVISKIVPPDAIQFLQPDMLDIPAGKTGGAVAIGDRVAPARPPHVSTQPIPPVPPGVPTHPIAPPPTTPAHPIAPAPPGGAGAPSHPIAPPNVPGAPTHPIVTPPGAQPKGVPNTGQRTR